jgi:hypothetical protein
MKLRPRNGTQFSPLQKAVGGLPEFQQSPLTTIVELHSDTFDLIEQYLREDVPGTPLVEPVGTTSRR